MGIMEADVYVHASKLLRILTNSKFEKIPADVLPRQYISSVKCTLSLENYCSGGLIKSFDFSHLASNRDNHCWFENKVIPPSCRPLSSGLWAKWSDPESCFTCAENQVTNSQCNGGHRYNGFCVPQKSYGFRAILSWQKFLPTSFWDGFDGRVLFLS